MFARRSISYEDSAGVRFFLCDLVDSDERFFLRGLADSDERFFLRGSVDSDECFLLHDLAVLVTVGRFGVDDVTPALATRDTQTAMLRLQGFGNET